MKVESTLPQNVFFIHLAVLLDVVILVFVLTMLTSRIGSDYGFNVKLPSSQFLINATDDRYVLSVTAGENPIFFINNKRMDGGLPQLKAELSRIAGTYGEDGAGRVTVVLYFDQAVNRGLEQSVVDMVLDKGMNCAVAAEPND
ncbi:MAG: hypothetical protein RR250_00600 [Akkermansia sp.]